MHKLGIIRIKDQHHGKERTYKEAVSDSDGLNGDFRVAGCVLDC